MKRLKSLLGTASPWVVIGMSAILVMVVLVLALMNYNREKEYMSRVLIEKGAALIKSFEAGARTGMMGMFGQGANMQVLLEEIASQPDILYIAIVDPAGTILAHSDNDRIGRAFIAPDVLAGLDPNKEVQWRIEGQTGVPKAFEAYKLFLPTQREGGHAGRGHMMMGRQRRQSNSWGWCAPGWMGGLSHERILNPEERPVIFIGMDVAPFEEAIAEDIKLTLTMSGILLLLGLGGVVSLFWMQSHLRSKKLLQDTQALTSEMVANIPEGIIVCGADGLITYINDIAIRLLGLDATHSESMSGIPAADVLQSDIWTLRSRINDQQPVVEEEMDLDVGAEKKLPVSAVATNIVTEEGVLVGHMFMIRDLSQVKQLQEEVRKADRMAAIGHLAAGVAHEVRNPLSSIKGYATYFGMLFDEGSENRKAAEVMSAEVDRLNRVISELLEMARPAEINEKPTDIRELLESSLRLVKQEAENAGVTVSMDIAPEVGKVPVDPDRMTQAMINLYVNAIQAMESGGRLHVRARMQGPRLVLEVADSGPGLPAEALPRVFDPYFTTKQTGTGLGLAIVNKIIEAHGGSVLVERTGPDGTTFAIILPAEIQRGA